MIQKNNLIIILAILLGFMTIIAVAKTNEIEKLQELNVSNQEDFNCSESKLEDITLNCDKLICEEQNITLVSGGASGKSNFSASSSSVLNITNSTDE